MYRKAVIAVGVPGSGKTTLLKRWAVATGAVYVCPDDIRQDFTGDWADQSRNVEIWEEAYRRVHEGLCAVGKVVLDATHAQQPNRQRSIDQCLLDADWVTGVWFRAPLAICLERNRNRTRQVPDLAICKMFDWLDANPPVRSEGFDVLVQVTARLY